MDVDTTHEDARRRPGKWLGGLLFIGACIAAGAIVIALLRGDATSQTETLFRAFEQGLEEGDYRRVMACIDAEYDYFGIWPELEMFAPAAPRGSDPETAARRQAAGRDAAIRALQHLFLQHHLNPVERDFTWTVHSVEDLGDGRHAAVVTFAYAIEGGSRLGAVDPPVAEMRFVLRRSGLLFPRMRILSHQRFPYRR